MKILDTLIDWIIEKLSDIRLKRKIKQMKKKDPFIYR
jgi:hypothetical protein